MHLFYTPLIQPEMDAFLLDEGESKHAVRVLRLAVGTEVSLVDGRGGFYAAVIQDAHPKRVVLQILSYQENHQPLPYQLHIGVAPTKNMDRLEWFVEKATEIGVTSITPLICERSERRTLKVERLEKVAIAAMKQSQKAHLPLIHEAIRFPAFLEQVKGKGQGFIAHCDEGEKTYLNTSLDPGSPVIILIGPEGDFSPDEISLALQNGFSAVSLGTARLRTETAALAACMEIALLNRK